MDDFHIPSKKAMFRWKMTHEKDRM